VNSDVRYNVKLRDGRKAILVVEGEDPATAKYSLLLSGRKLAPGDLIDGHPIAVAPPVREKAYLAWSRFNAQMSDAAALRAGRAIPVKP
jgi:hypothetical protein